MSQRDRILAIVVGALVVFGGGFFFIVKPKQNESAEIATQITAAQATLDGASSRAAQYRAARNELRKHPEAFEKAGRALPNRVAMPDLLRTLTKTTRGTGVAMGDVTTSSGAEATPGITAVNLEMSFDGDFLALQRYLARLHRFVEVSSKQVDAKGRLMALKKVGLSRGETSALSAKVSATVYVLQPGALTPGQSTAAAAPASGAATTPATPAPAPTTPTTTPAGGA